MNVVRVYRKMKMWGDAMKAYRTAKELFPRFYGKIFIIKGLL